MHLPKELTTVTPLSKSVALLMFISLPIITFFFGMSYQSAITNQNNIQSLLAPWVNVMLKKD